MSRIHSPKAFAAEKNNESKRKTSTGGVSLPSVPVLQKAHDKLINTTHEFVRENDAEERSTEDNARARASAKFAIQRKSGKNEQDQPVMQQHSYTNAIQRKVKVEGESYSTDKGNERDFRKYLMINLNRAKYRDLGNKQMWAEVNGWLNSGYIKFRSWDSLISQLWNDGFLDKKVSYRSSMGPKSLGIRPGFTQATKNAVTISTGQHRRHIISSSSLGLSIEKSYELLSADQTGNELTILNDWLQRNGAGAKRTIMEALREIWSTVHNHVGNLWPGPGEYNTAIGFIRGPLKDLVKDLDSPVQTRELKEKVAALFMEKGWYKDGWNEILTVLNEVLSHVDSTVSSVGLGAAMFNCDRELKTMMPEREADDLFNKVWRAVGITDIKLEDAIDKVNSFEFSKDTVKYKPVFIKWLNQYAFGKDIITKEQAAEAMEDFIANADLDYPYALIEHQDKQKYGEGLLNLYKSIVNPSKNHFDADGVLDTFMKTSYKV